MDFGTLESCHMNPMMTDNCMMSIYLYWTYYIVACPFGPILRRTIAFQKVHDSNWWLIAYNYKDNDENLQRFI